MKLPTIYHKTILCIIGGSLFILASCQPPIRENRLEQMAKDCCECTTQLMKLNQAAAQSPDKADFKAMEYEFKHAKDCLMNVTSRNGRLNAGDLKELEKQLQFTCPPLAAQHDLLRELLGE